MINQYNWLWESVVLVLIFAMCFYQAKLFDSHKIVGWKFIHWPWALFYINIMLWAYFIDYSVVLVLEILLLRMIFFNILLNRLRTPKKDWWYISNGKTPGSSWIDGIETKLYGPFYRWIWLIFLAFWIFLNFKYKN